MPRLARVLLLCLALTACGESADEQYKEDFPAIDRGLVALGNDVGEGLRGADDATLAQRFAGYARRLGRLRDRLDGAGAARWARERPPARARGDRARAR